MLSKYDFLSLFNLKPQEVEFCKFLFDNPNISIKKACELLKISKKTYYNYLANLLKVGLFQKTEQGFILSPKEVIMLQVENRLNEIEESKQNINKIQFLPTTQDIHYQEFKIVNGKNDIINKAIKLAMTMNCNYYYGVGNSEEFEKLLGENVESFWINKRTENKVKLRLLLNDKKYANFLNLADHLQMRETKYLNKNFRGYMNILPQYFILWDYVNLNVKFIQEPNICYNLFQTYNIIWDNI
jgi:predicted DNA-binding transcriptional regulator